MELNYKEDARIDITALELEWLEQAELAAKYGREWALAKKKVAILEQKEKVLRSKLIRKAYEEPTERLGQPKASAQTAEAYFRSHKKHIKLKQELIDAQYELDLIEVAKNEISFTRKAALENEVKLHIADWFAGPNVPRSLDDLKLKQESRRQDAVDKQVKVKRKNKKNKS